MLRSNSRASFFLAGNYLDDIMACALSESTQLAIAGTEVLESIVRGGLAAPNDVRSLGENNADYSGFLCL